MNGMVRGPLDAWHDWGAAVAGLAQASQAIAALMPHRQMRSRIDGRFMDSESAIRVSTYTPHVLV
jgi:hypothetical protein